MNIQIKNSLGKVLFEQDIENNSIKKTLEEAVRKGIDLSHVNLNSEDLTGVNLSGAKLTYAHFLRANLQNAILVRTDLKGADLCSANLKGADLRCTNFYMTQAISANFQDVVLGYTDFRHAILCHSDFSNVRFFNSDFNDADITGIKFTNELPISLACPSEGSFIAWKKILGRKFNEDEFLVKLLIPEDAKRSSATTNKCRCDKAKVLSIVNLKTRAEVPVVVNHADFHTCIYKVGEYVYPDSFDENRWNECSHGIHFFIDKQDAINY